MRYKLKSLQHNGIYVVTYEPKGFAIKIQGQTVKLSSKTEQMAIALVKKEQSASPPDRVFYRNFFENFLTQLKAENPSSPFLADFYAEYMKKLEANDSSEKSDEASGAHAEINFSEISKSLEQERLIKLNMTKEEKKRLASERKVRREALREKFGYAIVDGKKIEIANWTAEPSCLFSGRGEHPRRGNWKEGPREEDITLNIPPESPKPPGNWKGTVWEPEKMYIAKWQDKLTGKVKYVWFSDSAFVKQMREREKFSKADKLDGVISRVRQHIDKNLNSSDEKRRKIATVCWLIFGLNLRVGDEKDPGEADTVGAITLRPEHIKVDGETLHFDFLGKDSVRWIKSVKAPQVVISNIEHFSKTSKGYIFEGIDSGQVTRFLSEIMDGLTAKVFRTWRTTQAVKEYLDGSHVKREDAVYVKHFHAKMANLQGAEIANHKRKVQPNFDERLAKKEARLTELEAQLEDKRKDGKKTGAALSRVEKAKIDLEISRKTKEYNLGTSLKSYIDPKVYVKWASNIDYPLEKLYPKTLQKKFLWALEKMLKDKDSLR